MKSLGRRPQVIVFFLVVAIPLMSLTCYPYQGKKQQESLFFWAKKYYIDGIYRESIKKMNLLLAIMDKNDRELNKRIHLLLGAAYEQLKKHKSAREHYRLARKHAVILQMDEIDLTSLIEYRRVFLNQQKAAVGLISQ